jgi:Flp pilus assembly protein TadG
MEAWFKQTGRSTARVTGKASAIRGEEGAEIVEFALSMLILFPLLFGLVEICMVLFFYGSAAQAAHAAARWASTKGATSCSSKNASCVVTQASITSFVHANPGAANMTSAIEWCTNTTTCSTTATTANASSGDLVQVKVSYSLASVPYLAKSGLTLSSTAEMVIWQ